MDQVILALQIAQEKHAGQTDKQGLPYVFHPIRVALRLDGDMYKSAALLHDILEDTDTTEEELRSRGISTDVINIVKALTKPDELPYFDYIKTIRDNSDAMKIKIADLHDNMRDGCPASLRERYKKALDILNCVNRDCPS